MFILIGLEENEKFTSADFNLRVCVDVLLRYDFQIFLRNVGVPVNGYIKRL